MGRHQPADFGLASQSADPSHQGGPAAGKDQPLQHRRHQQFGLRAGHQTPKFSLPALLPAKGIEAEIGPRRAHPRGQQAGKQLPDARNLQMIWAEIGGKQHQSLPAPSAAIRSVEQGRITAIPGMEKQRRWIGIK